MSADPAVTEFLRPFPDRAASEAWATRAAEHWRRHGFGQWVVEIPGEASFIGVVGLAQVPYQAHFTPAVEVAWRLARAYWGRGFASEAARASLDYGFAELGLAEIVARHRAGQPALAPGHGAARHDPPAARRFRPSERPGGSAEAVCPLPLAQSRYRAVTILLVRHGETLWNLERRYQGRFDSPLTARGIAQAVRSVGCWRHCPRPPRPRSSPARRAGPIEPRRSSASGSAPRARSPWTIGCASIRSARGTG